MKLIIFDGSVGVSNGLLFWGVGIATGKVGVKPVPPSIKLSKLNATTFDGVVICTPAISAIFLFKPIVCDGGVVNGTFKELGRAIGFEVPIIGFAVDIRCLFGVGTSSYVGSSTSTLILPINGICIGSLNSSFDLSST